MASESPQPSEDDSTEEDASIVGGEPGAAGGSISGEAGGERAASDTGIEQGDEDIEEGREEKGLDEAETTPFFGERMQRDASLKLLSKGDSLPISYRSDNGTRESEFYEAGEKENMNPYYDVVRRLSPTELIGRFTRTSSPRVS